MNSLLSLIFLQGALIVPFAMAADVSATHFCRCQLEQYTSDHYELIRVDIFNGAKNETILESDISDQECHFQLTGHPSCKGSSVDPEFNLSD